MPVKDEQFMPVDNPVAHGRPQERPGRISPLERQRRRIAYDLHDGPVQVLSAALMRLRAMREEAGTDRLRDDIDHLLTDIGGALDGIDGIARELRPAALDAEDLASQIGELLDDARERYGIETHLDVGGEPLELTPRSQIVAFRIAQEALNNVCKHAAARSVRVGLTFRDDLILLTIEDDGVGFDVGETEAEEDTGRYGLLGMKERAGFVHGIFEVESAPGRGTRVAASLPARSEWA